MPRGVRGRLPVRRSPNDCCDLLGRFAGCVGRNDRRLGPDRGSRAQAVRLSLPPYRLTATLGKKDGTNSGEVIWVVWDVPSCLGGAQRLIPLVVSALARASPQHALCGSACFGRSYTACLPKTSEESGAPGRWTALPRRPLPLGLQRPVGGAASLGGTAVRATARPGTLPRKLPLVLAISNEPGRFFGRVAFGRAGHGYITFRWNNAALGLPQRKGHSPRTRGSRTSGRLRRRGGESGGVPPHPPSRQPRCFGVLFVHTSHDG